jgi:RNA-binding protein YhbY
MNAALTSVAILFIALSSVCAFFPRLDQRHNKMHKNQLPTLFSSPVDLEETAELTPKHIKTLRKEASKRSARKELAQIYLLEGEWGTSGWSQETLSSIGSALDQNEMCQVRGISKHNKKKVFAATEQLIDELSEALQKDVYAIETKGHAVTLYQQQREQPTIQLRTTLKSNDWTKQEKQPRDNRGQIIRE